ncbi:AMP-binding protein [Actibacterium pelagium]|uniref:Acetyl-CoA synthetase n=1 Tax=Actibacterium pelagium TaxID=2029103 RepID=A0A917EJC5_9RHOB|nr:AMP-binding protein [Actibacterium pelagium]GGE48428.1 acetyl-CoA synthetase [Actibacterium pelagium]
MLKRRATIEETRDAFRWDIPKRYNIGVDVCDRIALNTPDAPAIIVGETVTSFAALKALSNKIANVLSGHAKQGDRIAVLLPQRLETAASHIAILKMGAISLPLFTLFGPEALMHRLRDSGARVLITDAQSASVINGIRSELPDLEVVFSVDASTEEATDLHSALAAASDQFDPVDTAADDPAFLIYTSGTTGNPKGALHAHRVLLGHLPGVEMSHNYFPQPGDRIWTPADWAWIGGLLDVLMPALHHGVAVVAHRFAKFDGLAAFELMKKHKVRNAFLPPTALKIMRQVETPPEIELRSIASGGETLGAELISWGEKVFGTTINEFYGQTECNMIVSSCAELAPAEPGVMGFAVPGHEVRVLAEGNNEGPIAVRAPDPVMFLEYWKNPKATAEKFVTIDGEQWLLTGDTGMMTETGRIRFVGRDDDIISSGGYRIGPAEIEDCLLTHPAVQMAGVVGKPDALRGEIVVAFVQLADSFSASEALAKEIAAHVKERLAAYEYPREVRFLDTMPTTTTGKIIRRNLREMCND